VSKYSLQFSCVGNIELTYVISPSATPDPSIRLPTIQELKELKAANDDCIEHRND
jgi:hypothetical protein